MDFTPEPERAVAIPNQNLQIIACAGSGKTRVVAARVINILRRHGPEGVTPEHIVAFTLAWPECTSGRSTVSAWTSCSATSPTT